MSGAKHGKQTPLRITDHSSLTADRLFLFVGV
jgi:hypothetical protein